MSRLTVATNLLLLVCIGTPSGYPQESARKNSAWDTVTLLNNEHWVTREGTVKDVRGSTLLFESRGGVQIQTLSFRDVRAFTFTANPDFIRGVSEFKKDNFQAASQYFSSAFESESRDWAKAEILARQAVAMVCDGQRNESVSWFQKLYQLDPSSRLLGHLPLVWDETLPPEERLTLSAKRLSTGDEVTRLAVASCVLHDPDYQRRAAQVLKRLRSDSKSSVLSQLASAQLWRLGLLSDDDSVPMLVDVWNVQWNRMLATTRPGPGLVLGRCLQQQHLYERAALVLLWSPLVHTSDPAVAAASLNLASDCLMASGQKAEAETVYRELLSRFPRSSAAGNSVRSEDGSR